MTQFPELLRSVSQTLARCNVQPHEKVVILTDSEREPEVIEAFYAALSGIVTRPGQYDLYGTCMVNCAPIEESVNGVAYLDGPLILYGNPEYLFTVSEPIRIVVENGRLSEIDGKGEDGRKLNRWIDQ